MNDLTMLLAEIRATLMGIYRAGLSLIPEIVSAGLLRITGWLLGSLVHALIGRVGTALMLRIGRHRTLGEALAPGRLAEGAPRVAATIAYWGILLAFIFAALERLGLGIAATLLDRLGDNLPNILLAVVLMFFGVVAGNVARQGLTSAATTAGIANAAVLGRAGQIGIVIAAFMMAADQIGVESTLLIVAFAVVFGATFGGIALAFGIGSAPIVSNVIAGHYVRRRYRAGQRIRVGAQEGRVLEVGPTSIILDAGDTTVEIPMRKFAEDGAVLLRE